jgi:hypothetical protein
MNVVNAIAQGDAITKIILQEKVLWQKSLMLESISDYFLNKTR